MNDESKSTIGFGLIAKSFLVLIVAGIPSVLSLWILTLSVYINGLIRAYAFLFSIGCFFLGSLLLVFLGFSKEKAIVWASGLVISFCILLASSILYIIHLAFLHLLETLIVSGILLLIGSLIYAQYVSRIDTQTANSSTSDALSLSTISISKPMFVGGIELVQLSESHFSSTTNRESYKPYLDLLRAIISANIPLTLRIERTNERTRIFYLTWSKQESRLLEYIQRLEDNITTILVGMKFNVIPKFTGIDLAKNLIAVTASLTGEPLSIEEEIQQIDAITSTARLLQNLSNGIIQISANPIQLSNRRLKSLENQYKKEVAQSERVISTPKEDFLSREIHESITKVDPHAQRNAASLAIQIDRLSMKNLCEVHVSISSWDVNKSVAGENAMRLLTTLRGRLALADKNREFVTKINSNIMEGNRLLRGEPTGKSTLLSIGEAAVYFNIPNCDVGIPVVDYATFHSNPANLSSQINTTTSSSIPQKPSICIGKVLDESGREISDFWILLEDLATHSEILGDIGTGKTTTQLCILHELLKHSINFLIFLKSKNEEYLRFIRTNNRVRIFTIGDDTIAPGRFCLTSFHEAVHVNQIINSIKTVFVASKPMEGMVREYSEKVIELTFKRMGWDRDTNTRGLPLILQDFLETIPLIEEELQYSIRGNQDFRGALVGRFSSICEGVLANIFGTITGISLEELVSKSTIFLLDKMSREEAAFFMFWLINNVALYYESLKKTDGPSEIGLKHYVVLEEAHRFLESTSDGNIEEGHSAFSEARNTICTTMTESRSSELGFGLTTPHGVKLSNGISTIALNVFMHKTNSITDRRIIGSQINCNDDQITKIGSLEKGVVVVRTASNTKPVLVRINNPLELYPKLKSEVPVSDTDIKKHMEPILTENPHFKFRFDFTRKVPAIHEINSENQVKIDFNTLSRLYTLVRHPSFNGIVNGIDLLIQKSNSLLTALTMKHIVLTVIDDYDKRIFYVNHLLWLLSQMVSSWSADFEEHVISNLAKILPCDRNSIIVEDTSPHERIKMELVKRNSIDNGDSIKSLLKEIVKQAIEEQDQIVSRKTDTQVKPLDSVETSLQMIDAVIKTKLFTEGYFERLRGASEGDIDSFLRLLTAFSKKLASSSEMTSDLSLLLLHRARSILNEPADEELWAVLSEAVKIATTDRGAPVAA